MIYYVRGNVVFDLFSDVDRGRENILDKMRRTETKNNQEEGLDGEGRICCSGQVHGTRSSHHGKLPLGNKPRKDRIISEDDL